MGCCCSGGVPPPPKLENAVGMWVHNETSPSGGSNIVFMNITPNGAFQWASMRTTEFGFVRNRIMGRVSRWEEDRIEVSACCTFKFRVTQWPEGSERFIVDGFAMRRVAVNEVSPELYMVAGMGGSRVAY